jgi:hypothetical protein
MLGITRVFMYVVVSCCQMTVFGKLDIHLKLFEIMYVSVCVSVYIKS